MSDYTPTTQKVEDRYWLATVDEEGVRLRAGEESARAEFRAWLAEHDAKVRAEERERALVKHYDYIESLGKTAMSLGFTGFGLGYARAIEQVFEWAARIREQGS